MSTIAKRDAPPSQQASAMILASRDRFAAALGAKMTVEQLAATLALTVARTPGLAECSTASIVLAAFTGATLGLSPDPIRGEFYLVPFKKSATPVIGYKGLIKLARRGGLERIMAHVVQAGDQFEETLGAAPDLKHSPSYKGEWLGAYAICWLKDNPYPTWAYLRADEIESIRKRSPSGNSPAWKDSPGEMWKKTAIRRLLKLLNLDLPEPALAAMEAEDTESGAGDMKRVFASDLPALDEPATEPVAEDPPAVAPPPTAPAAPAAKAPPPAPLLNAREVLLPLADGLPVETVLAFVRTEAGCPVTASSIDQTRQDYLAKAHADPVAWRQRLDAYLSKP